MIKSFELFEKKSEKANIDDKYKEYVDKIQDKRVELSKISQSDDSTQIKLIREKIKRAEISISEKELDILRLRDQKLLYKEELKTAEKREKEDKERKKKREKNKED